jgi:hypothetical protein
MCAIKRRTHFITLKTYIIFSQRSFCHKDPSGRMRLHKCRYADRERHYNNNHNVALPQRDQPTNCQCSDGSLGYRVYKSQIFDDDDDDDDDFDEEELDKQSRRWRRHRHRRFLRQKKRRSKWVKIFVFYVRAHTKFSFCYFVYSSKGHLSLRATCLMEPVCL